MSRPPIGWLILAVVLAAATGRPLWAEDLRTFPVRYLTIEADQIVLAEPLDVMPGLLPLKYHVVEVFKGDRIKQGDTVNLRSSEIHQLSPPRWLLGDLPTPTVRQAILFLRGPAEGEASDTFSPVLSGLRGLTPAGDVLVPRQLVNPGPLYLLADSTLAWDAIHARIRSDVPEIRRVYEMAAIADWAPRNQALLTWLEAHREDFEDDDPFGGWAPLDRQMLRWIQESCIPEDCWRAVRLASELNASPNRPYESFCSFAGRELLVSKVMDTTLEDSERLLALRTLSSSRNFWGRRVESLDSVNNVSHEQQESIIQRLLTLQPQVEPSWLATLVECLTSVSGDHNSSGSPASKTAVPVLTELYRSATDYDLRVALATAIRRLEDEAYWKRLTGNSDGIVVLVRLSSANKQTLTFHMNLMHSRAVITEPPIFRLERIDDQGYPLDTRRLSPDVGDDLLWREIGLKSMKVPATGLEPGHWRVTVEGHSPEGNGPTWQSISNDFEIVAGE